MANQEPHGDESGSTPIFVFSSYPARAPSLGRGDHPGPAPLCPREDDDYLSGGEALQDLHDLPLNRYPHDILTPRVWELRAVLTAYDAVYVVLAELLDAPLLTCDRKIALASGHRAKVEVI